jgi:hypothetical protein
MSAGPQVLTGTPDHRMQRPLIDGEPKTVVLLEVNYKRCDLRLMRILIDSIRDANKGGDPLRAETVLRLFKRTKVTQVDPETAESMQRWHYLPKPFSELLPHEQELTVVLIQQSIATSPQTTKLHNTNHSALVEALGEVAAEMIENRKQMAGLTADMAQMRKELDELKGAIGDAKKPATPKEIEPKEKAAPEPTNRTKMYGIELKPPAQEQASVKSMGIRAVEIWKNLSPGKYLSNPQLAEILSAEFPHNSEGQIKPSYVSVILHAGKEI